MAHNQRILKLIEQAAVYGWTNLNLSGSELKTLPSEITKSIAASLLTVDYALNCRGGRPTPILAFITKGRRV